MPTPLGLWGPAGGTTSGDWHRESAFARDPGASYLGRASSVYRACSQMKELCTVKTCEVFDASSAAIAFFFPPLPAPLPAPGALVPGQIRSLRPLCRKSGPSTTPQCTGPAHIVRAPHLHLMPPKKHETTCRTHAFPDHHWWSPLWQASAAMEIQCPSLCQSIVPWSRISRRRPPGACLACSDGVFLPQRGA